MAKRRISEETVHQALQALSFKKRLVRKHPEETLKQALQELKETGAGLRSTARKYGIPKTTLMDWRNGKRSFDSPHPNRALLPAEEEALVSYIFWMAAHGFPIGMKVALMLATEVCKVSGRVNPFVNMENGLSKMWWCRFKARHPKIASRKPSYLEVERYHGATEPRVDELFRICQELYDRHGFHTAPELIYNCDETGFGETKGSPRKRVLCEKGQKTLYAPQVTSKEHITVHCCVSAAGESIPPFVIFQKCLPRNSYSLDGPPDALYGVSDSGFMDCELFLQWLRHFVKHARKERPLVLFMDQHEVHVGTGVVDFCRANQVEVVCLPSHTTHVLQPLDVSVYGPLKAAFNEMASVLGLVRGNMIIGKRNFTPVLRAAIEKAVTPENIQSGFRKTGLYPLDRQAVDSNKLVKKGFKRKLFDGNENPSLPTPGEGAAAASTSASTHTATAAADGNDVPDTAHHKAEGPTKTKGKSKEKEPSKGKGKAKAKDNAKKKAKEKDKNNEKRKSKPKENEKRKSKSKDQDKRKSKSKDQDKRKSRSKVPAKRKRRAKSPSSTSNSSLSIPSSPSSSSPSSSRSPSPSPRRPATATIAIQTPWAAPDSPATIPSSAFTCSTNPAFPYITTNLDFPTTITTTAAAAGTSTYPTIDAVADTTTTTTDAAAAVGTFNTEASITNTTTTSTTAAGTTTTTTDAAAAVGTFNTEASITTTTTTSTSAAGTSNTSTAADNYNATIADAAVGTSSTTAADITSTADCSTTSTTTTTTAAAANTTPPTTPCSTALPTTPCSTALPTTPCSTSAAGTAWSTPATPATPCSTTPATPATPCTPGQCPTCRRLPNPLVSSGIIPPSLADILLPPHFEPSGRPRGKRVLLPARVITSEAHAALLEQQKQDEVRKQQEKLDRAKERAEERAMLREMRQELKRQEKQKEKEARQQQREELAKERAAAKQSAAAAVKVARQGARPQKRRTARQEEEEEEEEEETREVRQASAWAAQETQEVDRDMDSGSQNAVQEVNGIEGVTLQAFVQGTEQRGQNSAVQDSQAPRGQRGQNSAVQDSQAPRGQRGQNSAVQDSQAPRGQRGQNSAVQDSWGQRGQNGAVLCGKCGEGGAGLFFQSPCCDLWFHANCVNVTMVTEMQLVMDMENV